MRTNNVETNTSTFLCNGCQIRRPAELYHVVVMAAFSEERGAYADALYCSEECKEKAIQYIKNLSQEVSW